MTNVYRIGVQIAMASNGAQVLGVLSRHLTGVHGQVRGLEGGFNKLKLAIGGALAIAGGAAIIGMFKGPLDEARKFEMAVGRFSRFGLGTERTREAAEFAKSMNIAGSTYVENMNRMAEAQGVFRESGLSGGAALRGAKMAAPVLAKIDFANSALDEDSKAKMKTQALSMLRFVELRGGVNSPEQFNAIANAGFKAITSSGGNINWEQLRQFMARGGVAAQGLSNEALFAKLEPVIGELKGSTAGFALRTAYNRLNGINSLGMGPVAHELIDAGIWDKSKVSFAPNGGLRRFNHGSPFLGAELFASDPVAFYEQKILPMYAKRGLTQTQIGRENALIFGGTGGAMFNLIQRQLPAINRSVDAQRVAMGIDQAYGAAGGTLNGKILDLHARFTNLMERLGEAVLPMAVKGLEVLVPAIVKLTDWVGKHPGAISMFAKASIVIGGALVALGTVALGAAAVLTIGAGGPLAIIIAGLGALAGAIAGFAMVNFGTAAKVVNSHRAAQEYVKAHPGAQFLPIKELYSRANAAELHKQMSVGLSHNWKRNEAGAWVMDGAARPSAVPSPANTNQPIEVTSNLIVDGKRMATVVSRHQAAALGGNMAATGRHDPDATLASPAAGYNR